MILPAESGKKAGGDDIAVRLKGEIENGIVAAAADVESRV
jgi:hypothetical protein